jgi:ketosteroid isomerase-like protein
MVDAAIISTENMDPAEKLRIEKNTRKWVKHFIDNVEGQTYEAVLNAMTPDSYFVLLGNTPVSGKFTKEECFTKMAPEYERYIIRPTIKFSHIMVDGDMALLRASGSNGTAKYGPYAQPWYGYWFRAVDEGYAEIIEWNDPIEMATKMYGTKLVSPEND